MPEDRRRNGDIEIEILTERVNNWMDSTTEYRKSLCAKLDSINSRLNDLPCKASAEERKSMKSDIAWLQRGAVGIISVLFLMGVAWGTIANTVEANTKKWAVLEPEHQELIKDVEVLKEKSYGYRGIKVVQDGTGKL